MESVREVLINELRDLYDAEALLVKALPKVAKAASSEQLQEAIQEHLEQTKGHVERLQQAFEVIGEQAKKKACKGMRGLLEEGQELMEEDRSEENDLRLIGAAQRVEHYEIAAYGTVRTLAESLGYSEAAELLQQTLDEEKETDERLTTISEGLLEEIKSNGEQVEEEEEETPRRGAERAGARQNSRGRQTTRRVAR
jgi:ferritin-like metal-binding protein YciE